MCFSFLFTLVIVYYVSINTFFSGIASLHVKKKRKEKSLVASPGNKNSSIYHLYVEIGASFHNSIASYTFMAYCLDLLILFLITITTCYVITLEKKLVLNVRLTNDKPFI